MAQGKKISELNEVSSVTDNDEFLFVDKEGSGANSGVGGKTAKIKFSDLKSAIGAGTTGAKGASGDKGMKGEPGPRGLDGEGTQYWTQSPTDGNAVYYNAGNVGIGTDSPSSNHNRETVLEIQSPILSSGSMPGLRLTGNETTTDTTSWEMWLSGTGGPGSKLNFSSTRTTDGNDPDTNNRMTIDHNGNVGIGTDSPSATVHIQANSDAEGAYALWVVNKAHDTSLISAKEDGDVQVAGTYFNSHARGMRGDTRTNAGYVGIGTQEPSSVLTINHVHPQIRFEDADGNPAHVTQVGSYNGTMYFDCDMANPVNTEGRTSGKGFVFRTDANTTESPSGKELVVINQNGDVAIGTDSYETLTGGSTGYKLVVSGDTSTGTSILMHNSYAEGDHVPQTWRMIADPSKKYFAIGQQGSSFASRLQLHSGTTGGFTFGDDGNGAKTSFSTIRFPSSGVYPSLDLIRNVVINELDDPTWGGAGTAIQFGALKNDLDENLDAIPGTRGPQAGARILAGLYPAHNARGSNPMQPTYGNNYGKLEIGIKEYSGDGGVVKRMEMHPHGRTEFFCHQNGGEQKTYSSSSFHPHSGVYIRNLGDPAQAKFSGISFQSSGQTGGYATGWIGVVNGVGGQPTGDMVFGTRMADGTDNAYGERMRLTQDGNFGIGTDSPSAKLNINAGIPAGVVNTVGPFKIDASSGSSESASFEVEVRNTTDGDQYASLHAYNSDTSSGLNPVPLVLQRTGGNVGIGNVSPGRKLDVNGTIGAAALESGGAYAVRGLAFNNIQHGINISLHGLYNLNGSSHRNAMVIIQFKGMTGNMTTTTQFKKAISISGLTQWGGLSQTDVGGYGSNNANITKVSGSSTDIVLHVALPAGINGVFKIELIGANHSTIDPISYSVPTSQAPEEGYESIPQEASSVPTESNELQELKKLVTDLSTEVESLKSQLKGIE